MPSGHLILYNNYSKQTKMALEVGDAHPFARHLVATQDDYDWRGVRVPSI